MDQLVVERGRGLVTTPPSYEWWSVEVEYDPLTLLPPEYQRWGMLHLRCGWACLVGVAYSHSRFSSFTHLYVVEGHC